VENEPGWIQDKRFSPLHCSEKKTILPTGFEPVSPPDHEWEGGVLNHCTIEVYDAENEFSDVVMSPI
jgi:hypothetical protein